MLTLALVLIAIQSGVLAGRHWQAAAGLARILHKANVWLLGGLAFCLFARPWNVDQLVVPLLAGILLQLVPAAVGVLAAARHPRFGRDMLIFSTYGGGNRGVLLLTLFSPNLLPLFIAVDMGNFISLLVFFPWLARRAGLGGATGQQATRATRELALLASAVLAGIGLGRFGIADISSLEAALKTALSVSIPLYLGLQLNVKELSLGALLRRFLCARIVGVGLVAALIALLAIATGWPRLPGGLYAVLMVFFALPVSSLLPTLAADSEFRSSAIAAAVGTAALYALILSLLALGRLAHLLALA